MKKLIIFALAHLLIITSTIAQNNIWSLPPNYYKIGNTPPILPLPAPGITTPTSGPYNVPNYAGQQAEYVSNAMQDANGNLLFFIVDGMIYDKEGYGIDFINSAGGNIPNVFGYSEIAVVPVPGNCQQYYIIINRPMGVGHVGVGLDYVLLDLSVTSVSSGRQGALIDPVPNNGYLNNQAIFTYINTTRLDALAPGFLTSVEPESKACIAVTKLRSDNTRLLFATGESALFRFKITASGIVYDNFKLSLLFPFTPSIIELSIRTEMEIITTGTGYRLAFSYPATTGQALFVAELTNVGDIIGTPAITVFTKDIPNSLFTPNIKGIEFSPNGNFIYLIHSPTNTYPLPFKIYNVATQAFIPVTNVGIINQIANFKNSQIELGKDGKLYLANATNLATIGNPDNPGGLTWNNTAVSINYNLSNLGFPPLGNLSTEVYTLPDQIDGMDYTQSFFINAECCVENSSYDVAVSDSNNTFTGSAIWSPGVVNNPFGSASGTVTVKDQLIIKSGANITINNMRFEFAPKAQLIVENGARLTINGTTLTADTRCTPNAMWQGVEVWGQPVFQPVVGGYFIVQNNSVIENALEATANSKHLLDVNNQPITANFNPKFDGGIIQTSNSKFKNNASDVWMEPYNATLPNGSVINDRSKFINTVFVTDNSLNDASLNYNIVHVKMDGVNGISFLGCDFKNIAPSGIYTLLQRGKGIESYNTKFQVSSRCLNLSCTNTDISNFNNLTFGIRAISSNPLLTAQITKNNFDNNWRSIYLKGLNVANVSENTLDIGQNSSPLINMSTVSYGLYLDNCTGYKVENNQFNTTHNGYLGVYVNNSGQAANEIYRNTFNNLVVGSQASSINGNSLATDNGKGLVFRCNKYTNTFNYDILVSSGRIKSFQGTCTNVLSPANNTFSYTASGGDFWMENYPTVTNGVSYEHSIDNSSSQLAPRNGYFNVGNTFPSICTGLPIFNELASCPLKRGRLVLGTLDPCIINPSTCRAIDSLKVLIDGGNTQALLSAINNQPSWQLHNTLMAASPYLSDKVMIAALNKTPKLPNWVIEQVLTANAPLTDSVLVTAINRIPVLPNYLIQNLVAKSSPINSKEQLAIINHNPKYPDWMLSSIMGNNAPLKDKILLALINKTPAITSWSIRNILMKNTPLSLAVSDAFNYHIPAYPLWVINNVNNSKFVAGVAIDKPQALSLRTEVERAISYYASVATRLKNDALRVALFDNADSLKTNYKNVANLLQQKANKTNAEKQLAVNALMANQNYVAAQQKLNTLDTCGCVSNANFCKLNNTVVQCQQYPSKLKAIKTNLSLQRPVNEVATATTKQQEVSSAKALKVVVGLNALPLANIQIISPSNNSARIASPSNNDVSRVYSVISIYPNPTKEQFTLTQDLSTQNGEIRLTVFDLMGRALINQQIVTSKTVINTKSLKTGIYFYSLTQNNITIKTDKLVIK